MLELVAKRAALRPSDAGLSSLSQSENISLPVLPAQTKINPLLQEENLYNANNRENSNVQQHTFSSQSHNQEHDVSFNVHMRSLHGFNLYEQTLPNNNPPTPLACNIRWQTILVVFEFLILYIAIVVFSLKSLE